MAVVTVVAMFKPDPDVEGLGVRNPLGIGPEHVGYAWRFLLLGPVLLLAREEERLRRGGTCTTVSARTWPAWRFSSTAWRPTAQHPGLAERAIRPRYRFQHTVTQVRRIVEGLRPSAVDGWPGRGASSARGGRSRPGVCRARPGHAGRPARGRGGGRLPDSRRGVHQRHPACASIQVFHRGGDPGRLADSGPSRQRDGLRHPGSSGRGPADLARPWWPRLAVVGDPLRAWRDDGFLPSSDCPWRQDE